MAVRIKFDRSNNALQPTFVLANRSGKKIGKIPAYNIRCADRFNSFFETSFKVNKTDNGKDWDKWDQLRDFKLAYCKEHDVWCELYVSLDDDDGVIKSVIGKSLAEAELSQIYVYGVEANTDEDFEREDYEPTVLYDDDKKVSLIDRLLYKAPHYSVEYVAPTLRNIQRIFSFDGISIYDAFMEIAKELNCIFVFHSGSGANGKPKRSFSVYDLESYCVDCGTREEFSGNCPKCGSTNIIPGYGEDTTIFVSKDNLADGITYETNTDSVKNCFKLEAGDDLMTAAIVGCNPNGSEYIWYISDDVKADMSDELRAKLESYDELYDYYVNSYSATLDADAVSRYNSLVNKYYPWNNSLRTVQNPIVGYPALMDVYYGTIDFYLYLHDAMMPGIEIPQTTAQMQVTKISSSTIPSVAVTDTSKVSLASANNAVTSVVKAMVSPEYQVKIVDSSMTNLVWTGKFKLTNYSNEEDFAESSIVNIAITDDFELAIKQRLNVSLGANSDNVTDVAQLFALALDRFILEIKKYNLVSLSSFEKMCQACINILIENGIADDDAWQDRDTNLYDEIYYPYYQKLLAIQDEMRTREEELSWIIGNIDSNGRKTNTGLQDVIDDVNASIQNSLNFQDYLGDDLWLEFAAYRREDTYSNPNYISDGLDNTELFNNARDFLKIANDEIFKSANLQHSISASLKNLLVMKEFKRIVDMFQVGNWIRIKIDGSVYRLRLISYEIDYSNLGGLNVKFSDVQKTSNGLSDAQNIMQQAASMSTSYDSVRRQSKKGSKGKDQLNNWVEKGLALTNLKIISDADYQNISWDENGLLCRQYDPITDDYDGKQLKLINRGLYFTTDNWKTSKAGIGDFMFYNPITGQTEESYGVIADTLVGSLILGENVGVYSPNGNVTLDSDGISITSEGSENSMKFTVQKKFTNADGEDEISQVMYLDSDGNLVLTGSVLIQSSYSDVTNINDLCDATRYETIVNDAVNSVSKRLYSSIDEAYNNAISTAETQLNNYKSDIGQYMQFGNDGLTLGAETSDFKTTIDNRGMYFKQGDRTVAYINNNQLYINDAIIKGTFTFGKFFISPREDGGASLTWHD